MSRPLKHGMSRTPVGVSWQSMLTRCYNKKVASYKDYGGRGIIVCEFLRATPLNLLLLLGDRPAGSSIDRKNNDGSYTCGECAECLSKNWSKNVRWATRLEQNRNQSDLVYIEVDGITKCASEWAQIKDFQYGTLRTRFDRGIRGIQLFGPPLTGIKYATINGVTRSAREWAEITGIKRDTILGRIEKGFVGEAIIAPVCAKTQKA